MDRHTVESLVPGPLDDRHAWRLANLAPDGSTLLIRRPDESTFEAHHLADAEAWTVHDMRDVSVGPLNPFDALTASYLVLIARMAPREDNSCYTVATRDGREAAVEAALVDLIVDHPMWEGVDRWTAPDIAQFCADAAKRVVNL
jgi:hypothetical protein